MIVIVFLTILLFTEKKDVTKEHAVESKQEQIERSILVLDSLGERDRALELQVDSLEKEINKTERVVSNLKTKKPLIRINF